MNDALRDHIQTLAAELGFTPEPEIEERDGRRFHVIRGRGVTALLPEKDPAPDPGEPPDAA